MQWVAPVAAAEQRLLRLLQLHREGAFTALELAAAVECARADWIHQSQREPPAEELRPSEVDGTISNESRALHAAELVEVLRSAERRCRALEREHAAREKDLNEKLHRSQLECAKVQELAAQGAGREAALAVSLERVQRQLAAAWQKASVAELDAVAQRHRSDAALQAAQAQLSAAQQREAEQGRSLLAAQGRCAAAEQRASRLQSELGKLREREAAAVTARERCEGAAARHEAQRAKGERQLRGALQCQAGLKEALLSAQVCRESEGQCAARLEIKLSELQARGALLAALRQGPERRAPTVCNARHAACLCEQHTPPSETRSSPGERRVAEPATAAADAASRRSAAAAAYQKAVEASKAKHAASEAQRRADEREQAAARKAAAQQADKERRRDNAQRARCRKEEEGRARIAAEEAKLRQLLPTAAPASKGLDGLVAGPNFMDSKPRRKVTVGSSQRLLPPQRPPGRKTIVFDLDETLVSFLRTPEVPAGVEPGLWFRQGAVQLLQRLRQKGAEIIVWTAGGSYYAEAVTSLLDPSGAVEHIVARHSAWFSGDATYTKKVSCLGRPLSSTLLVDNNPQCAAKTPGNTLIVPDYEGGACPDNVLGDLESLLLGWLESDCASEAWLAQKAERVQVDTTVCGVQRVPHLRPGTKDDRPRRVSAA